MDPYFPKYRHPGNDKYLLALKFVDDQVILILIDSNKRRGRREIQNEMQKSRRIVVPLSNERRRQEKNNDCLRGSAQEIRNKMAATETVVQTINKRGLLRKDDARSPKCLFTWRPPGRNKEGRPRGMEEEMADDREG
ncbi:hypothetical protein FQA39_LY08899 [Lamprigera yunnana]|nr:hypothetical protein FQA39_LY08899 [Lamprigera yunnana]